MLVPNRYYNGPEYRYGFNGMEKDGEIKGEGNSYDFGARMFDPRIGRWFKIDNAFKELPYFSPYIFVNNNPNQYVDPDGDFLIDVHKRITNNAFMNSKIKLSWSIDGAKNYMKLSAYHQAILGSGMPGKIDGSCAAPDKRSLPKMIGGGAKVSISAEHFDNMDYKLIQKNFARVDKAIDSALELYKDDKFNSKQLGMVIGEHMHAVQDFYSHSNFIELYKQIYGETELSEIPTLQEALSEDKHKKFAKLLKSNLKTGTYPNAGGGSSGPGSHKEMNHDLGAGSIYEGVPGFEEIKDKDVNWNSKAAEYIATKATTQINDKVEKVIVQ